MKKFRSALLRGFCAATLVLAGCASYEDVWTPPSTPQGAMCVAHCENTRQACQFQQQSSQAFNQTLAQQCQADYNRAMMVYQSCRAQNPPGRCTQWSERVTRDASGKETRERVCSAQNYTNPCVQPTPCSAPRADTSACDTGHRACYRACGGRIERMEIK